MKKHEHEWHSSDVKGVSVCGNSDCHALKIEAQGLIDRGYSLSRKTISLVLEGERVW